jgi:hypothetical protein
MVKNMRIVKRRGKEESPERSPGYSVLNNKRWLHFLAKERILVENLGVDEYFKKYVFILEKMPDKRCNKCFGGRGFVFREKLTGRVIPCDCVGGFSVSLTEKVGVGEIVMDFYGDIRITLGGGK